MAQAIASVSIRQDFIPMIGGLDITTPPYQRTPGLCRAAQNFEQTIDGGYRRVAGYERFDGRPAPSDATYSIMTANITGSPAVGNTLVGATSAATGVIIALPGGSFVLTKIVGTFQNGENLNVGGPTIAVATDTANQNSAATAILHAQYLNLAADQYRADIAVPTGSGKILGGFYYNDVCYVFRNNAGGTAANLWKSSTGGWVQVAFEYEIAFTAGSGDIDDGDTLTQGGVTATIRRVAIRTGTLAGANAAGILVISAPAGGNFAAGGAITTGAGALTLSGAQTAITLQPNGRFRTIKENFGGAANTTRVYGCDGVNRGFEFDGSYFVPIPTGMTLDQPTHVIAHKKHLFFSFVGSVQHSGDGTPFAWSVVLGASEIGMGDTVTGFAAQPGSADGGALSIYTRNRCSILYGSSSANWHLEPYRDEIGAYADTIQDVGFTMFLDDRGITDFQTTQAYGNFAHSAVSNRVKATINEYRLSAVASCISRDLSQYRLFFTNNFVFYVTVVGRKVLAIMPVLLLDTPRCAWSSEKVDGSEVIFFGSDSGKVFQMEKGTSFDGADVEFSLDLAYNFQKSPRTEKSYKDAALEISGSNYATFNFGYSLGYGQADIPQPSLVPVTTSFSSVFWDAFTWDSFIWDGITLAPSAVDIDAAAENISLAIQGASDYIAPFTITGAVLHYTHRRRLRP